VFDSREAETQHATPPKAGSSGQAMQVDASSGSHWSAKAVSLVHGIK
jgi:hypothetical protein